jgi:hypothetical protein
MASYPRRKCQKKGNNFYHNCPLICLVLARNHEEQTNHCIYSLQGGFYMDPFAKRNVTSCLGIPVGGIG